MMMDSKDSIVEVVTDRLGKLLDDRLLHRAVDAPVDKVARQFFSNLPSSPSTQVVHEMSARFVQAVYSQAIRCPRQLSLPESMAEALSLLAQGYQSPSGERGYEAALVDAVWSGQNGLSLVLATLADLIKFQERRKWTRWAVVECLYTLDQTALSELNLAVWCRISEYLPHSVQCQPPFLAVDTLAKAIIDGVRSDNVLRGILDSTQ